MKSVIFTAYIFAENLIKSIKKMARPIKKATYDRPVGFRISSELHKKLFEMSLKTDCSLSDILTQLVEYGVEYLENDEQAGTNETFLQLQEENVQLKKIIEENKTKYDEVVKELNGQTARLQDENKTAAQATEPKENKQEIADEQTINVLNAIAKKLSDRLKKNITASAILKNYVMKYNIEQYTEWFHPFVLNANDIREATGENYDLVLKNLPKIK